MEVRTIRLRLNSRKPYEESLSEAIMEIEKVLADDGFVVQSSQVVVLPVAENGNRLFLVCRGEKMSMEPIGPITFQPTRPPLT